MPFTKSLLGGNTIPTTFYGNQKQLIQLNLFVGLFLIRAGMGASCNDEQQTHIPL